MLIWTVQLLNTFPHPYLVLWKCDFPVGYDVEVDRFLSILKNDPGVLKTYRRRLANYDFQPRLWSIRFERWPKVLRYQDAFYGLQDFGQLAPSTISKINNRVIHSLNIVSSLYHFEINSEVDNSIFR